jgi:kynurenine formamidase
VIIYLKHGEQSYEVDLNSGIDISIPLDSDSTGPNCFFAPLFLAEPLIHGDFIGDTRKGSPVNFYNVNVNPHGNGTHTECVGHISRERISINKVLKKYHFIASLVSVYPTLLENGDKVVLFDQIKEIDLNNISALILRSLPNHEDKKNRIYSDTNPPYIDSKVMTYLRERGVKHFLTDLPSVDREEDEGRLLSHKAFWSYPDQLDEERTITEMVFVPNEVKDGTYFINIQIPSFVLDAAPSKIVMYELK